MLKKTVFVAIPVLASLFLQGCAPGTLLQTAAGMMQGLLGAGVAPGVGGTGAAPIQNPLAGLLPGGGQPATPGTGGLGTPTAGGPASAMGQRIKQAAYELPDPFPYKPGTEGGNLGCADVVTHALEVAGVSSKSEHQLSVDGARELVRRKGFTEINPPPWSDGDIIIWGPLPGGRHQHIGIIVIENGQVYAINNSSSQKKPVKVLLSTIDRAVKDAWRAPGGAV